MKMYCTYLYLHLIPVLYSNICAYVSIIFITNALQSKFAVNLVVEYLRNGHISIDFHIFSISAQSVFSIIIVIHRTPTLLDKFVNEAVIVNSVIIFFTLFTLYIFTFLCWNSRQCFVM